MFTVVSSFQSTVALHKTPLYILHYEASERSAVSYTHSGITGTGCSTGAMSATSAAKSTGGSTSSLQHPLLFASKRREAPFIHSP